jgi:hypothetical protein
VTFSDVALRALTRDRPASYEAAVRCAGEELARVYLVEDSTRLLLDAKRHVDGLLGVGAYKFPDQVDLPAEASEVSS